MACAPYSVLSLSVWQQAIGRQLTSQTTLELNRGGRRQFAGLVPGGTFGSNRMLHATCFAARSCKRDAISLGLCLCPGLGLGLGGVTILALGNIYGKPAVCSLPLFAFFLALLFFNARRSKVFATRVFWQSFKPHVVARFARGRSKVVFGPITIEGLQCI